jgi:hypothetical protein
VAEARKKPVRAVARKTVRRKQVEVTHEAVAERAYYIALEQGGGRPFENWLQAERELAAV